MQGATESVEAEFLTLASNWPCNWPTSNRAAATSAYVNKIISGDAHFRMDMDEEALAVRSIVLYGVLAPALLGVHAYCVHAFSPAAGEGVATTERADTAHAHDWQARAARTAQIYLLALPIFVRIVLWLIGDLVDTSTHAALNSVLMPLLACKILQRTFLD